MPDNRLTGGLPVYRFCFLCNIHSFLGICHNFLCLEVNYLHVFRFAWGFHFEVVYWKTNKGTARSFWKEVISWPKVDHKKMFGCPCYLAIGSMFAGLVTKGIVITKLTDEEKLELSKVKEIGPFIAGEKVIRSWVQINLETNEFSNVLHFVKKS